MSKLWKDFRVNLMYWRFRHITRNRLRFRQWRNQHRSPSRPVTTPNPYRGYAATAPLYRRSRQRTWIALAALVILLTGLKVGVEQTIVNPGLVYALGVLIIVGCTYWALRSV